MFQFLADATSSVGTSSGVTEQPPANASEWFAQLWESIKSFFSPANLADVAIKIVLAILLIILCHYLVKLINWSIYKGLSRTKAANKKLETKGKKLRGPVNVSIIYFVQALIRTCLYIAVFVIILAMFGLDFTGLGTILAGAVAGISLSLQDVISSFAYGVIILTTHEFQIGDYIMLKDGTEGTVEKVNLLTTVLITVPKERVFIPNNIIGKGSVINTSAVPVMVARVNFTVPTTADMELVRKTVLDAAKANPRTLPDPEPVLLVTGIQDHSMALQIRAYTKSESYWNLGWELNEAVVVELKKVGITVGRGDIDVHIADDRALAAERIQAEMDGAKKD